MDSFQKREIDRIILQLNQVLLQAPELSAEDRPFAEGALEFCERIERGFKIEEREISVSEIARGVGFRTIPTIDSPGNRWKSHDLFAQFACRCFGDDAPKKVAEARRLLTAWLNGMLVEDGADALRKFFSEFKEPES